jgi:hypothetical protein
VKRASSAVETAMAWDVFFPSLVYSLLVLGGGGWNQGQILNGEGSTGYGEFGVLDLMVSKYC